MGNTENKEYCTTDCCAIDQTRTIKDVSEVKKSSEGVLVNITAADVRVEKLEEMVVSCQTGACDCMSPEIKQKITGMEITNTDGKLSLSIKGDVSEADIAEAMAKSVRKI